MKLSKIILLCIITVVMTVDINASRTKKDLLLSKEEAIAVLLKEKITILDKLIIEAKIYKKESDPLIKKSFFNTPNLFLTDIQNSKVLTNSSSLIRNRRGRVEFVSDYAKLGKFSFRLRKSSDADLQGMLYRDILNIKMRQKFHSTVSFSNNINFIYLLSSRGVFGFNRINETQKKEFAQRLGNAYDVNFQSLADELLQKYHKLISLLSENDLSKKFGNKMGKENPISGWSVNSRMFVFELYLDRGERLTKKKKYDKSAVLNDTFENLLTKKEIELAKIPDYYDKKINRDMKCLETSKNVKYKGRICIDPIDVDKDIYFKEGTFESRENNFIQINGEYFKSLVDLDKQLRKSFKEYVKFLILKASSITKTKEINLEEGLWLK